MGETFSPHEFVQTRLGRRCPVKAIAGWSVLIAQIFSGNQVERSSSDT